MTKTDLRNFARSYDRDSIAAPMEARRGSTIGYRGRRYARVFNTETKRREWWEVEKIGKFKTKHGVVPELKFIKRVPTRIVPKLWEARLLKIAARGGESWAAVVPLGEDHPWNR